MTAQAPTDDTSTTTDFPLPGSLIRAVKRARNANRDLGKELAKFEDDLAARGIRLEIDDDHGPDRAKE